VRLCHGAPLRNALQIGEDKLPPLIHCPHIDDIAPQPQSYIKGLGNIWIVIINAIKTSTIPHTKPCVNSLIAARLLAACAVASWGTCCYENIEPDANNNRHKDRVYRVPTLCFFIPCFVIIAHLRSPPCCGCGCVMGHHALETLYILF
jgi:hypothetical protein